MATASRALIGAEVRGANGDTLGEVDDLLADAKGQVSTLVVQIGGVGEIGDKETQIPWRNARVDARARHVTVPMLPERPVEQRVKERGSDEVTVRQGEWRVKELIDDPVNLRDGGDLGEVEDVIISRKGEAEAVVVLTGAGIRDRLAFDWVSGQFDVRRDVQQLPLVRRQIAEVRPFSYTALGITGPAGVEQDAFEPAITARFAWRTRGGDASMRSGFR